MTRYLELADYLHIAEAVPGVPAELIADFNRIGLADSALAAPHAGFGGVEAYPDFATKAAVLCCHPVRPSLVLSRDASTVPAAPRRQGGQSSPVPVPHGRGEPHHEHHDLRHRQDADDDACA